LTRDWSLSRYFFSSSHCLLRIARLLLKVS
jgi:hypothetical protein